jgi:sugar lactone lactonase YvrE
VYVSPDGSLFLPVGDDFVSGALYYGTKMADVLRAFALRTAVAGSTFYVTDEGQEETYAGRVNADGSLSDVRVFANRGGEGTALGPDGGVYLAAGQVYAYSPAGTLLEEIEVPERPTGLLFGGRDGRTLFILARSSLYSVHLNAQ